MEISAENPRFEGKVPHLMCKEGDIAEVVLIPGDPARVNMFQDLCDDFRIVASNREYTIGTGKYQGYPVSICSTGIGGPSTEIAVIELIELGAKALIRIGGTGVLTSEIKCGDMVITTGSMRLGGSSSFYAPVEYPAVASFEVIHCLIDACKNRGSNYWKGISASVGSFFAGQGRTAIGKKFYNSDLIEKYRKLNIINMEMESETILTLGNLFGIFTGSICAVHANRETDEWLYDFSPAQKQMCMIALDAVVLLYNRYLSNED
ncbi:nucleoside phosphorylase [Paratissierella segnis]|jgi:uridine phosphorylase|uniref:Uridine phosphorylase n=1 Tax=Paratissierella segnis TaxID=2763679 RepID=A0A926IKU6_9FIRM|nr:nucleoside phosphorylase [Paratissierella segnis]MBC8588675.1 nucleoside phosphorylase [Paratissierella segnis]